MFDLKQKHILVTGGSGFLGTQIVKKLISRGVLESDIIAPRKKDYDLRRREICDNLTKGIDVVIHAAGTVGGVAFNREHPAVAFYDNAVMSLNLIDSSYRAGVQKFVGIGTVCEYPKFSPIPFKEDDLWNGYPEETNAAYGLAKKMMLIQSQAYRAEYGFNAVHLLLTNLYGPGDNFDAKNSHALVALVRKTVEAATKGEKFIEVWGKGKATREFLYVEDAAEAIVLAAEKYNGANPVNIGSGEEISIKALAELIMKLINFQGEIKWDPSKPDGQPRRSLDVSRAQKEFGFKAKTPLDVGLRKTIEWWQSEGVKKYNLL
ncbi:MAG TPA: GDP-L-fucose synthase [Candidatus Paceibacterota bacterium]|nr:GDP-L-fucose synthase [Candidatus Paceibacterota bacterium]